MEVHGLDKNSGNERYLSTYIGRMIKGSVSTENNKAPHNVAKTLDFLPEVAIRYTKLTKLSLINEGL